MKLAFRVRVDWSDTASDDMDRLTRQMQDRIIQKVDLFAATGHGDVDKLEGTENQFRLKIGKNWRVFFHLLPLEGILRVDQIKPRGSAYKK